MLKYSLRGLLEVISLPLCLYLRYDMVQRGFMPPQAGFCGLG